MVKKFCNKCYCISFKLIMLFQFQIFAQNSTAYLMLFNALWRAKRMEWILSGMWKRQATSSKLLRKLPGIENQTIMPNLIRPSLNFLESNVYADITYQCTMKQNTLCIIHHWYPPKNLSFLTQ